MQYEVNKKKSRGQYPENHPKTSNLARGIYILEVTWISRPAENPLLKLCKYESIDILFATPSVAMILDLK